MVKIKEIKIKEDNATTVLIETKNGIGKIDISAPHGIIIRAVENSFGNLTVVIIER